MRQPLVRWALILLLVWFAGPVLAGEPLRLALAMQPGNALLLIALDQGYFRDQGLDLAVERFDLRLTLGQALVKTLEDEARWAIRSGLVTGPRVPDVRALLDPRALKAVQPQAVNLAE